MTAIGNYYKKFNGFISFSLLINAVILLNCLVLILCRYNIFCSLAGFISLYIMVFNAISSGCGVQVSDAILELFKYLFLSSEYVQIPEHSMYSSSL